MNWRLWIRFKPSYDDPFVAEVPFFVVADIEINFTKRVAGMSELLHGELGGFIVNGLVEVAGAVPVPRQPKVVSIALVVEMRQVGFAFADEA